MEVKRVLAGKLIIKSYFITYEKSMEWISLGTLVV